MDSKHYILPYREDPIPVYLRTAARMLDLTVDELCDQHSELANMLSRVNERILKIKPYGLFQSTQAISTVIELYFIDNKIDSRITELECKLDNLDDYVSRSDRMDE